MPTKVISLICWKFCKAFKKLHVAQLIYKILNTYSPRAFPEAFSQWPRYKHHMAKRIIEFKNKKSTCMCHEVVLRRLLYIGTWAIIDHNNSVVWMLGKIDCVIDSMIFHCEKCVYTAATQNSSFGMIVCLLECYLSTRHTLFCNRIDSNIRNKHD